MELGWPALVLLALGALVAWFWQDSLAARELANAAALDACNRLTLQFLDGTVAFANLTFVRGTHSLFSLRRTYVFDYTANSIERRQGFVVLTGRRVDSVGYASGDEHRAAERPITEETSGPPQPSASNVLSIEEWRARQRSPSDANSNPARHNGTHAGE